MAHHTPDIPTSSRTWTASTRRIGLSGVGLACLLLSAQGQAGESYASIGLPGVVAAPVFYAYLKAELTARGWV